MKIVKAVKAIPAKIKPYADGIRLAKCATKISKSNKPDCIDKYRIGTLKHVWGVTARGDEDSTLWTINDIDITYDSATKKYYLGVETIYEWDGDLAEQREGQKEYLMFLYDKFRRWMISKGYDISQKSDIYTVFGSADYGFDSIPEVFAYFRILVSGFCAEVEPTDE